MDKENKEEKSCARQMEEIYMYRMGEESRTKDSILFLLTLSLGLGEYEGSDKDNVKKLVKTLLLSDKGDDEKIAWLNLLYLPILKQNKVLLDKSLIYAMDGMMHTLSKDFKYCSISVMRWLLEHGADPNSEFIDGVTMMVTAAYFSRICFNPEMFYWLVVYGGDLVTVKHTVLDKFKIRSIPENMESCREENDNRRKALMECMRGVTVMKNAIVSYSILCRDLYPLVFDYLGWNDNDSCPK